MVQDAERRWALIAGGSGGIGAATARELASTGWNVALTYLANREGAETVAADVRAVGSEALVFQLALEDAERTADVVAEVARRGLAGVVYAAGPHITMAHVSGTPPALFRSQLEQDSIGCYNLLQPSIAPLRETSGAIVAMVTPAIKKFVSRDVLSSAPKAVIEQVIRAIAKEEGRYGIRANAIGVGLLAQGMIDQLVAQGDMDETFLKTTHQTVPLKRLGTTEEVAAAVAFLLSSKASFITGQTLNVDGGFSI